MQVYLKKNCEKDILQGQCWVYANQVARILNRQKNGSLAEVYTFDGKFLGKGYVNFLSKILIRMFVFDTNQDDNADLWRKRIEQADAFKRSILSDDNYRVVFAEADNLPALIVDRYADVLVVQFLSLGVDMRKKMIVDILVDLFNPTCVYERSDVAVRQKEGLQPSVGVLYGALNDEVIITENGLKLSVDVVNGQKTGYFLDQKFNRQAIRRYCKDKTVLDCFCNCGGFTVNAALSAKHVTAVDVSQTALDNVQKNALLNRFNNVTTLKADVFELLRAYKQQNTKFDVVILDPPAFTKSADQTQDAVKGYRDINLLGFKLVNAGGYLVTCSCSHYVDMPLFLRTIRQAAAASNRRVRLCEIRTQSPDHASLFTSDNTAYLKFLILKVD